MRSWLSATAVVLAISACNDLPSPEADDEWRAPVGTWVEVFRDEFEGPAGSAPRAGTWNLEIRPRGQNGEQDFDTDRRDNSFLDGEGHLVLQALAERYEIAPGVVSTQPYTSARLDTEGHVEPTLGRVEARIKLPLGRGIWPAFWLLGKDISTVEWPECGEVDVMELRGSEPAVVNGSLHGPLYSGGAAFTRPFRLPSGTFADDFHVFALEWTHDGMRWMVDEQVYHTRTRDGLAALGKRWVFDQPYFIILNLAVGGAYDGAPDDSTMFPSRMVVDYVKVSRLDPAM
jgi:beta-glucanase (GH16 family)